MLDLESIRADIDQVDRDLVALLERRMDLVTQVVAYKKENGKAILDQKREEVVLDKVASRVGDKAYEATIVETFRSIMSHSRDFQKEQLEARNEA